jgi:prevent-host-death family protein
MPEKPSDAPVRIIGSRELHQNLPGILRELERPEVRYVLTVHGKPRAVLIGAEPFLDLLRDPTASPSEALVGLQLTALLGGKLEGVPLDVLERAVGSKNGDGNGSP